MQRDCPSSLPCKRGHEDTDAFQVIHQQLDLDNWEIFIIINLQDWFRFNIMQVTPVQVKVVSSGLILFSTYQLTVETRTNEDRQHQTPQSEHGDGPKLDGSVPNPEDDLSQQNQLLHQLMAHRLQEVMQVCIQAGLS